MSQLKIKRLHADAQGPGWYLYAVEFDAPDGMFNTHIYAINDEHAQMMCTDLRESAWRAAQGERAMTDFARCAGTTAEVCRYCRRRGNGNWPAQPHVLHQPEANNWCSQYVAPQPISVSTNTG